MGPNFKKNDDIHGSHVVEGVFARRTQVCAFASGEWFMLKVLHVGFVVDAGRRGSSIVEEVNLDAIQA